MADPIGGKDRFRGGLKKLRSGGKVKRQPHSGGKAKCGECGHRVRGKHHEDGDHHKKGGRK